MKILAFAGSISSTSINRELIKYVLQFFEQGDIHLLDLNDYEMPIFSEDREKNGFPEEVIQLMKQIGEADLIICSLAEHNRTYSAAFKNTLDWMFRISSRPFQGKSMFLLATSPIEGGGEHVLKLAETFFPTLGADIKASFLFPLFGENFDTEHTSIRNKKIEEALHDKIQECKKQCDLVLL